ncbi:hypothetical protein, partial [Gluconobacter oxydans]|uniref:hypothetical protein n=1 Tax=Gluconobacter oxydans TaxID=442 RepID=UPI00209F4E3B
KETKLLHLPCPQINSGVMESHRNPQNQRVFRTLHLIEGWNGHAPISELGRMADIPSFSRLAGEDFAFG